MKMLRDCFFAGVLITVTLITFASCLLAAGSSDVVPVHDGREFIATVTADTGTRIVETYEDAKNLKEGLLVAKQKLLQRGDERFIPLLGEADVRDAIRSALSYYELTLNSMEEDKQEYMRNVVIPTYTQIAGHDAWPQGTTLSIIPGLRDLNGATYKGLLVRIEIDSREEKFAGFALPILDLLYGRPSPE